MDLGCSAIQFFNFDSSAAIAFGNFDNLNVNFCLRRLIQKFQNTHMMKVGERNVTQNEEQLY